MINFAMPSSDTVIITKECLRAVLEGSFFPEWEFETLFGIDRETVQTVYDAWPTQTIDADDFSCAVVGSLNNLIGYPTGQSEEWSKYISVSPERVREALNELTLLGL